MDKDIKNEKEHKNSETPKMCGHITKKGTACKNRAEPGHIYCKIHMHDEPSNIEAENESASDMSFLMNSIYNYHENGDFLPEEENIFQTDTIEESEETTAQDEILEEAVNNENNFLDELNKEELLEEPEEVSSNEEIGNTEEILETESIEPIEELLFEESEKEEENILEQQTIEEILKDEESVFDTNEEMPEISEILNNNIDIMEEKEIIKEEKPEELVNIEEESVLQEAAEKIKNLDNDFGIDFEKIMKEIDSENAENNSPETEEVERKSVEMSESEKEDLLKSIDDDDDIPILLNELEEEEESKEENDELEDLNQLLESIDENSDLTQVIGAKDNERGKNLFDDEILEELDLPPKNKKDSGKKSKVKSKKEPSKIWTGLKYFIVKYKYKIFIFIVGIALISTILVMKNPLQIVKEPKLKQEVVSKIKEVEIKKTEGKENIKEAQTKEEEPKEESSVKESNEEAAKTVEKTDEEVKKEPKEEKSLNEEKTAESKEKSEDLIDKFENEVSKLKENVTAKERENINKNIEEIVKEIKKSGNRENSGRAEKIRGEISKITVTAKPDIVKTNGINASIVLKVDGGFNLSKTVDREKLNRDIYKVIESGFDKFAELNSININIIKSGGRGKILEITARRYEFEKIDGMVKDYSSILSNFRVVER